MAVDTVYKGFKSKRELVRQVLAAAVVGDDQPVALADRPEMRTVGAAPTGATMLTCYAAVVRDVYARLGSLPTMLMSGARSGEADLCEFAQAGGANRLVDAAGTIEQLAATGDMRRLGHDEARDILWTLNSPEVHRLLTAERGWSDQQYERWLAGRSSTPSSPDVRPPLQKMTPNSGAIRGGVATGCAHPRGWGTRASPSISDRVDLAEPAARDPGQVETRLR